MGSYLLLSVKNITQYSADDREGMTTVMREIKEREEWLREMEELGQGDKYRAIIQQQIHAKIREMDKLQDPEEK
ncbi:hypothetical protein NQ318_020438 [Aromia moschata]|uniref:Uncharacterized protein n=1 Tax=Aromia moschata TaxID=1265417 RepID=A0AAV8YKP0_9CUCU|nr:hypothetical protein NQ318_020438 [Aromia moschata]